MSKKGEWIVFTGFLVFAIVIRFIASLHPVIDHDESVYLVIGKEILRGEILYKDLLDIKPIGTYLFFGLVGSMFTSVTFVRTFFSILVAATAYFIYGTKRNLSGNRSLAILSGVAYIICMASSTGLLSTNTEHIFLFFTSVAIYLLSQKRSLNYAFFAGLIVGLGFIIKYVVLFDFVAICLFFFLFIDKKGKLTNDTIKCFFKKSAIAFLGLLLPFGLVHLYYLGIGEIDSFLFYTYITPSRYVSSAGFLNRLDFVLSVHRPFLIFMVFFHLSLVCKDRFNHERLVLALWLAIDLLGIGFLKGNYDHYLAQPLIPICLLCPNVFYSRTVEKFVKTNVRNGIIIGLVVFAFAKLTYKQYEAYGWSERDDFQLVANYIKEEKKPGDELFVHVKRFELVGYLADIPTPDRLILYDNHYKKDRLFMFNTDKKKEFDLIWEAKPEFIVLEKRSYIRKNYPLKKEYIIGRHISDNLKIYRRKK